MTAQLRSLIVWLVLLALPLQGYAAATMMLCADATASASHAISAAPLHDHAAMLAAQAPSGQHGKHQLSGHNGVKCGAGAACCAGAAPAPTFTISLPALAAGSSPIPFFPDFLPAVHLAHAERPPQDPHA